MNAKYSGVSMLDMVFEHRNKAYGAYVLRRDYNKSLQQAMLSILTLIALFCLGNYIKQNMHPKNNDNNKFTGPITLTEVGKVQPKVITKPKPQVTEKPKPRALATIANTEKRVVAENKPHMDSIPTVQQLEKYESGLTTNTTALSTGLGATDGTGKDEILEAAKEVVPAQSQVLNWSEVMPEYPGGESALMAFISKNIIYPDMEQENGIGGKVTAQFTVNEDGTISDVLILKSTSAGFNKEVKRIIGKLDRFKPGMQQGKPVRVRLVLPFAFTMKQ